MIWGVAKHFMTALNPKADLGFKSSFPRRCILEEDVHGFAVWFRMTDELGGVSILVLIMNTPSSSTVWTLCMWVIKMQTASYCCFAQSDISKGMTWHMQKDRHDDNSDRGKGAKWNHLLTAHKRGMLHSDESPSTSRQRLQVCDWAETFIVSFSHSD